MHPAPSIVFFTTASGAGYGLLVFAALGGLLGLVPVTTASGLALLLPALALITAGLASSTLHLGHPERAWRAFSQWRSSWLSREGVAAVLAYLPTLAMGSFADAAETDRVAAAVARYSGLSKASVVANNLDIPVSFFWKDLLRSDGTAYTVGRLDSRYLGIDSKEAGTGPDYNAELTSWLHSFTPAINYYLREHLGFKTDIKYNMFGDVHPWDRTGDQTGRNLRQAMAQNPYLHVLFQAGYYDGATSYFDAKYTMYHLDPSGRLNDRISFEGYRSGHMMYLRAEDLIKANEDIRKFIRSTMPAAGVPAKY